jgi:hypothetical protein
VVLPLGNAPRRELDVHPLMLCQDR